MFFSSLRIGESHAINLLHFLRSLPLLWGHTAEACDDHRNVLVRRQLRLNHVFPHSCNDVLHLHHCCSGVLAALSFLVSQASDLLGRTGQLATSEHVIGGLAGTAVTITEEHLQLGLAQDLYIST